MSQNLLKVALLWLQMGAGVLASFSLAACGDNHVLTGTPVFGVSSPVQQVVAPGDSPIPATGDSPSVPPIQSVIDFSSIRWPLDINLDDQRALELALNITGSFEGDQSWSNISNNSDGQGMSLGLLSQNFGSGTLQPLLIKMQQSYPEIMTQVFSQKHLVSLYAMLKDWETKNQAQFADVSLPLVMASRLEPHLTSTNMASVVWATQNLYSKSDFVAQWKSEFQALAATSQYINYQFAGAIAMHAAAKAYAQKTGVEELRTYLMMFDVVDQNGSISDSDFSDYQTYLKSNPKASTTSRLESLLSFLLRRVDSAYTSDVKSRKMTIINGQGLVHGVQRNLETEFSFNRLDVYP